MCKKICWSIWMISSVILLLVDLRSVALLQKDVAPRRCFNCGCSNGSASEDCGPQLPSVECPRDYPYCGTMASLSTTRNNLTSSLVCVAPIDRPCSLRYCQQKQTYQVTCVCATDLCNRFFFSENFLKQVLNFISNNHAPENATNFTDELFIAIKINESTIYETKTNTPPSEMTTFRATTIKQAEHERLPQAEPLKQDATAPSDDDEDEGEGSGAFEETRSQKRPASVPAAPSSFLPANENGASPLFLNFLVTTPLFLHVIV